jgi:hypothetical protein
MNLMKVIHLVTHELGTAISVVQKIEWIEGSLSGRTAPFKHGGEKIPTLRGISID